MLSENIYTGQLIGDYRVIANLSSMPSSSLYQVEHTLFEHSIGALRLIHPPHFSEQKRNQFLKEVQVLKKLKHAHILSILDAGIFEGTPYLVREYAPGGSLRDRMNTQAAHVLPTQEVLVILAQVGQALQYAHQFNIVHGNLKPENILFDGENNALLADFIVVTALDAFNTDPQANNLPYMAPEQFQGWMTKECDQYALGCIAYELLTGQPPLHASNFLQFKRKHATEKPIAPTQLNLLLPISLEEAILKAMEKNSKDRYPSVKDFVSSLATPTSTNAHAPLPTLVSGQYSLDVVTPPSQKPSIYPANMNSTTKNVMSEAEKVDKLYQGAQTISPLPLSTPIQPYKLHKKPSLTSLPVSQKKETAVGTQAQMTAKVSQSLRALVNVSGHHDGNSGNRLLWLISLLVIIVFVALSVLHFAPHLSPSPTSTPTAIAQNFLPTPALTQVPIRRPVQTPTPAPASKLASAPTLTPIPSPTPLPTPSPTPTTTLMVTPTSLHAETDCQKSGQYYICTVTLLLSQNYPDNVKWYASGGNLSVFFNPSKGTLSPGQQLSVTAEVLTACPHTGTLNFFSKGGDASVQWVC